MNRKNGTSGQGAPDSDRPLGQKTHNGIRFLVLNVFTIVGTLVITLALLVSTQSIKSESDALQQANDRYAVCEMAANDLMDASSYLTTQSRLFASTHHVVYLDNYYWELSRDRQREVDVSVLNENYPGSDATKYLESALEFSNKLSKNELYSMKLVVTALNLEVGDEIADMLSKVNFVRGDEGLSSSEMLERAHLLVTYEPYEHDVDRIFHQVERCKDELAQILETEKGNHTATLESLFLRQQVLTCVLLVMILFAGITFIITVSRPISEYIGRLSRNERLQEKGVYELRFLASAYNDVFDDNKRVRERLTYEAQHDSLTGLNNRGTFERDIAEFRQKPMALVILDIDHFKEVNDLYGHDIGDVVLQETATALAEAFAPEGVAYRLGGDEFVVIVPGAAEDIREPIGLAARKVAGIVTKARDNVPAVGISAGVAFGDGTPVSDELYKRADKALYRVKAEGRQGIAYDDESGVRPFG